MRLGPAPAVRLLVLAVAVDALLTAVLGSDETGRFLSGETDGSALLGGAGLALLVVLCLLLWRAVREVTVLSHADQPAEQRLDAIRRRTKAVISRREITVALQPIVSFGSGRWVAVEALARFGDGRPPDLWFAEAQEVGLGVELELVALHKQLDLLGGLPSGITLSVNASPALVLDPRFRAAIDGVDMARLTVEITEHAAVHTYDEIRDVLLPLRERGLRLAVDDTGAGYASFHHVLRLRPDSIKLDRSLLAHITSDPARRAFVTAIVLLGLELGASVTAEGVETPSELETLATLGVDYAQGFLLARPSTQRADWLRWRSRTWLRPVDHFTPQSQPRR
jgi:EAL domain-containing protein (putative c-di-GMP-specific phosphodiesterase class I)